MGLRLDTLLNALPPTCRLLDVGTDHGLLAIRHVCRDPAAWAIASDRRPKPLAEARRRVALAGLSERIEIRLGDGLAVVEPGEVDVVCAAGFGGAEMARVLRAGAAVLADAGLRRLVLQPLGAEQRLRRALREGGLHLRAESLVHEGGFTYPILVAEPGVGDDPAYAGIRVDEEVAESVGPLLLRQRAPGLRELVLARRDHAQRVAAASAVSPRAAATRRQLQVWQGLLELL